jgi:hypothetical protein
MKKLLFGLAFFGTIVFTSSNANAQSIGGEDQSQWVCCQTHLIETCVDKYGTPYNGTTKVNASTCS